jgi:ATP-binding cassette subfamily F protein 3
MRRVNPIKLRQMQERLAQLEAEIPRVETLLAEAEQALGVYISQEETQRLSAELDALRSRQAELNGEWEELSLQLEGQETAS